MIPEVAGGVAGLGEDLAGLAEEIERLEDEDERDQHGDAAQHERLRHVEGDPPRWKELDIDHSAGISLRRRPKPNRRPRNLANLAKARSRAPMGWPPGLWARVQYIQTIRAAKRSERGWGGKEGGRKG